MFLGAKGLKGSIFWDGNGLHGDFTSFLCEGEKRSLPKGKRNNPPFVSLALPFYKIGFPQSGTILIFLA